MLMPVARYLLLLIVLSGAGAAPASQVPVLQPDAARVAEGGNVIVDVLANDTSSEGGFNIGSMYISSEATNGYLSIDSNGRISYTHYGGPTTADHFSYVIAGNEGIESRPAWVRIAIGDGPLLETPSAGVVVDLPRENSGQQPASDNNRNSADSASAEPLISPPAVVTAGEQLSAFHRAGQTFITWRETSAQDGYHVYRHTQPITRANLRDAQRLTNKWGALGSDTSVNVHGGDHVPDHFVINDLASPLSDNTGLFVYTTQPGDATRVYYAVTSVRAGRERSLMSMTAPVTESVATPRDVLTVKTNQGKGRIYTQFMDYLHWNPTFNGYIYNYAIALPHNYNAATTYPLMVDLHAYYEQHKFAAEAQYGWEVIQLFPSDPGAATGASHSWWYGYSNSHDYRNADAIPRTGRIENYTEQRVLRAIDYVSDSVSVDINRIHGAGNSMGASGLLALGMRYGSVFSGVYASQPMTNYASTTQFSEEFIKLWGAKSRNLPVINRGPHSKAIQQINVGVWDWMNHQKQLVDRRGTDMAFLMTFHGKLDEVIEWQTQGKPFVKALNKSSAGFSAAYESVGHTWVGFVSTIESLFGFGYDENFPYKYPIDMSFPSVQRAGLSGPLNPADTGKDQYNMDIEWATPHTPFARAIVDKPKRYEISIRSRTSRQTADITPRRTRNFRLRPGQQCRYSAIDSNSGDVIANGVISADNDALITVKAMPIMTGAGTRLVAICE